MGQNAKSYSTINSSLHYTLCFTAEIDERDKFLLISFRFCQISLRHSAKRHESRSVIVRRRWEGMQRKDMRQSVPVLHLKQGDAAKNYCLNAENYFDKQHP